MSNLYKPRIYTKDIFTIDYNYLKKHHIKYLLFDIDNTIAEVFKKEPSIKTINLFNKLKKEGFTIIIISNALKKRASRFANSLNVKYYYLSSKPLKKTYLKIIKENNLKIEEIAMIGDQIYTDILGANKLNILSIYVDRLSSKESIITKINRLREQRLFKKTSIIKRGEYYYE